MSVLGNKEVPFLLFGNKQTNSIKVCVDMHGPAGQNSVLWTFEGHLGRERMTGRGRQRLGGLSKFLTNIFERF